MEEKISSYIKQWKERCYPELPDEAPHGLEEKVPSYKTIVMAILRNDVRLLGYDLPKSKYYSILKRIEIDAREYNGKQLKLRL